MNNHEQVRHFGAVHRTICNEASKRLGPEWFSHPVLGRDDPGEHRFSEQFAGDAARVG